MNAVLEAREPSARYLAALEPPLLGQFNLIAQAPNGVARLRELILTLALQGKLVPQDPNDEPASALLERIRAEKARLVKEGKIRKDKPLPEIAEEGKPFALPDGWEWVNLGTVGEIGSSSRVHQRDWTSEGVPFYRAREIVQLSSFGSVPSDLFISEQLFSELSAGGLIPETNDLMITGVGTIGVPYVVRDIDRFYFKDASVLILKNRYALPPYFLFYFMKSPYWGNTIHAHSMGTTVHTLTIGRACEVPFPLPPLAEQSRIVARVEELMALCDEMEVNGKLEAEQHARLVGSLFDSLASSESAHALAENWQRIATHFDLLLDRHAAVDALEQTILQLAVRGLLVPQDPSDEPASVLLQKIRAEKDRLIAACKIKRDKPLPPIADEEMPFELPVGWGWARFGDVILASDAGWSPSCESTPRDGDQWGVLKVSAVTWGEFKPEENKALPMHLQPRPEYEVQAGDFLLSRANTEELVARSVIAWQPPAKLMLSDKLIRLRLSSHLDKTLYCFINNSASSRAHYIANASGTSSSMKNVSREVILTLPVPVPPAAEQSRIVARVTELRALCTKLRQSLSFAQQTQSRLADALVAAVAA